MAFKPVILWTDFLLFILIILAIIGVYSASKQQPWRFAWQKVMSNRLAVCALVILTVFLTIGILDSLHYRSVLVTNTTETEQHYSPKVQSVLDYLLAPLGDDYEKTYSAPFALTSFVQETIDINGKTIRSYPHLQYAGIGIKTKEQRRQQLLAITIKATVYGLITALLAITVMSFWLAKRWQIPFKQAIFNIFSGNTKIRWRVLLLSITVVITLLFLMFNMAHYYHIFGTSKVGQDVFYQTLKSIRIGLIIGTLTTLLMLPFAIGFGIAAGYFGGAVDDIIQYVYTTLSSIPGILLIAAAILSLQVFISNHGEWFPTLEQRADARLLALCIILGVTSWTGLCRLLRAETLKIREVDYIQAAVALGTKRRTIILKHILPNVMHIVLIAIVLDFSALVLAEAVLSYVGVGVDPTSISWGNMINSARLELAREPVVWWPLLAAFVFMFILVLAANLFADAVRDALDPRHQSG